MWETVEGVRHELSRVRRDGHDRPARVALHPVTWYEIAIESTAFRLGSFVSWDPRVAMPTLFGMTVVEDPSLAPGTWRLEQH